MRRTVVWWVVVAALMAAMQVVFAIGNLVEDDGGPLYGQLVLLAVMLTGAGLIASGITRRFRHRSGGSLLIAAGVLPSLLGISLVWFPPAVIYGLLALVVAYVAFRDASEERSPIEA